MKQVVKVMVVEDEMLIAAKVGMFLAELGYEVSALLPGAEEALAHLQLQQVDLALLDIQLNGPMDGIALACQVRDKYSVPVIFLTANADDATFARAKQAQPFAFLQKPFRKVELKRALELAIAAMNEAHSEADTSEHTDDAQCLDDRIFVRYQDKMVKIMFDEILHVAADRSYCRIVTDKREYLLSMPMKRLEDKLPLTAFQRVHRSHIVNLLRVDEVTDGMVRIAGELLPLSPAHKASFMKRLNAL